MQTRSGLPVERGPQSGQLGSQLGDLVLEFGEPVLGGCDMRLCDLSDIAPTGLESLGGGELGRYLACRKIGGAEQLLVAVLLLAWTAIVAGDQIALDEDLKRLVDCGEVVELMQTLAALLQLTRRLRAAQHQHGE